MKITGPKNSYCMHDDGRIIYRIVSYLLSSFFSLHTTYIHTRHEESFSSRSVASSSSSFSSCSSAFSSSLLLPSSFSSDFSSSFSSSRSCCCVCGCAHQSAHKSTHSVDICVQTAAAVLEERPARLRLAADRHERALGGRERAQRRPSEE